MSLSPETLLAILIVGLYLNDSLSLLHANEAMLEQGTSGRWVAKFATRRFTLRGKHVWFGGALPPNTLLFQLTWAMEGDRPAAPGWEAWAQRLRPFQWVSAYLFVLVLVLLPAALLARAGDAAVVSLLALTYASVLMLFIGLWLNRRSLRLSSTACLRLGAEMLLCPAVAPNLPRRLSLLQAVDEDFVSACRRLLRPDDWAAAIRGIQMRIDDELESEDEDSARFAKLTKRRAGLA